MTKIPVNKIRQLFELLNAQQYVADIKENESGLGFVCRITTPKKATCVCEISFFPDEATQFWVCFQLNPKKYDAGTWSTPENLTALNEFAPGELGWHADNGLVVYSFPVPYTKRVYWKS